MTEQRHTTIARTVDLSDLFMEVAEGAFELADLFTAYAAGWSVFHNGRQAELVRAVLDPTDGLAFDIAYWVDGMLSQTARVSFYELEFVAAQTVVVDWET